MPDEMIDDQTYAWYFLIDGEVAWSLNKEKSIISKFSVFIFCNEVWRSF